MNGENSQLTSNGSNPKFKSTKSPNQKIQPKPNGMLHPDPSDVQRHIQAQNKEMEEDLPSKWRAKKKKNKGEVSILVSDRTDFKPTKR